MRSCKQASVVPGNNDNDGDDFFWPLMISMLLNVLLVMAVLRYACRREPEVRIVYSGSTRRDAEASEDAPAPIEAPVLVPSPPTAPNPAQLNSATAGASASADNTAHLGDADDGSVPPDGIADGTDEESIHSGYVFGVQ